MISTAKASRKKGQSQKRMNSPIYLWCFLFYLSGYLFWPIQTLDCKKVQLGFPRVLSWTSVSAIPNLLGTRNQFHGKRFSHGSGRSWFWVLPRSYACADEVSLVPNLPWTSSGPRTRIWGPLFYVKVLNLQQRIFEFWGGVWSPESPTAYPASKESSFIWCRVLLETLEFMEV